jgi:tetratricopeptide (TPR) repeat protein
MKRANAAILFLGLAISFSLVFSPITAWAFTVRDHSLLDSEIELSRIQIRTGFLQMKTNKIFSRFKTFLDETEIDLVAKIRREYGMKTKILKKDWNANNTNLEDYIRRLIRDFPDSRLIPAVLLELADIYFEWANEAYLDQLEYYQEVLEKKQLPAGTKSPVIDMPERDYSRSINIYGRIIRDFPNYPDLDKVHYLLIYCLAETKNVNLAVRWMERFIQLFPDSLYKSELEFRLGEYYFDQVEFARAIPHYQKVLETGDLEFYTKALYKLAWAYFRIPYYEMAADAFGELIKKSQAKETTKTDELQNEALQYLAIIFSEWGGLEKATELARGLEPQLAQKLFQRFEEILVEQTRYAEAIQTDRTSIKLFPDYPDNPEIQLRIAKTFQKLGSMEEAVWEREVLVGLYGPGSHWYQVNEKNIQALEKYRTIMEEALYESAKYHHQQAQKSNNLDEYQKALINYQTFRTVFPKSTHIGEICFLQAEILYHSGDLEQAADGYWQAILKSKGGEDYLHDAAFNRLISYEKIYEKWKQENSSKLGSGSLPEPAKNLIRAIEDYLKVNPNPSKIPARSYQIGRIFSENGVLKEAQERLSSFILQYPRDALCLDAIKTVVKNFLDQKNHQELLDWIRKNSFHLEKPEEKEYLGSIMGNSLLQEAQKEFEAHNFDESSALYREYAEKYPDASETPKAIFNLALGEQKRNNLSSAILELKRLERNFPQSTLTPNAIYLASQLYEGSFDFVKAVLYYKKLTDDFPDFPKFREALLGAGELSERLSDYTQAAGFYRKFLNSFPNDPKAPSIYWHLALSFKKGKDVNATIKAYEAWLQLETKDKDPTQIVEALSTLADLYRGLIKIPEASKYYQMVVNYTQEMKGKGPGIDPSYAAQALLIFAQNDFDQYVKIDFIGKKEKDIESKLIKKEEMLGRLIDRYQKVIETGDPKSSVQALDQIGLAFRDYATKLLTAPPPRGLSEEEKDIYAIQLEEKVEPYVKQSQDNFLKALQTALKFLDKEDKIVKVILTQIRENDPKYNTEIYEPKTALLEGNYTISCPTTDKIQGDRVCMRLFVKNKEEKSGAGKEESGKEMPPEIEYPVKYLMDKSLVYQDVFGLPGGELSAFPSTSLEAEKEE